MHYVVRNFHRVSGKTYDAYFDNSGTLLPEKPAGDLDELNLDQLRAIREKKVPAPVKAARARVLPAPQEDPNFYFVPSFFARGKRISASSKGAFKP